MNPLKKIVYNCKHATFLIEKQQIKPLTPWEKLQLRIHFVRCDVCKIFQQQSIAINRLVHSFLGDPERNKKELDEDFKKELQDKIDEEMRK